MSHLSAVPSGAQPTRDQPIGWNLGDSNGQPFRAVPASAGTSREQAVSIRPHSTHVLLWWIAADQQLLPLLTAHAVAFPVQIEPVGWEHADRTLNVPGSVA